MRVGSTLEVKEIRLQSRKNQNNLPNYEEQIGETLTGPRRKECGGGPKNADEGFIGTREPTQRKKKSRGED